MKHKNVFAGDVIISDWSSMEFLYVIIGNSQSNKDAFYTLRLNIYHNLTPKTDVDFVTLFTIPDLDDQSYKILSI